jgi:predicted  nucleic acid-binding Zn-ribbon protein
VLEILEKLIDLQALDDELASAEQESAGIPQRREKLAATSEAAQQRLAAAEAALHEAEGEQRKAEAVVQDKTALRERLEGQQFQVKSNEAYTALLHEIEAARAGIDEGETRLLELMDAIDASAAERAVAEKEVAAILSRVATDERALDAREKELGERVAQLATARAALCESVDGRLLQQYERIASRRRPAVVRVEGEICLGCRVNIPPQLHIELLRGERLHTCFHCHRILIPDGQAGPPEKMSDKTAV